jgi:hypothetical protein
MDILQDLPVGLVGLILAVVVYAAVFGGKKVGLVVTKEHSRLANVLLAAFLAASQQDLAEVEQVLIGLMASLLSAGFHALMKYIGEKK